MIHILVYAHVFPCSFLMPDQHEKIKVLGYATNLFYTGCFFQLLTRIKWIYMSFEA